MWTEQTIINPVAWSPRVEYDLLQSLRLQLGLTLDDPSRNPPVIGDPVDGSDEAFAAAREQLAGAADTPQIVTLTPGAASLALFPVPSAEERTVHESLHESARLEAIQDAALIARIEGLRRGNEHQQIEREARIHEWLNATEAELGAKLRQISGGATGPSFSATPNVGSGLVSATLDTSLTAPTNITSILTAGSSGTQIFEVVIEGVGTTVASVLNLFRWDATTYHLYEQVLIPAVTSSTTAIAFRTTRQYTNLILKSGDVFRIAQTVAGNQSMLKVTAHGGDL